MQFQSNEHREGFVINEDRNQEFLLEIYYDKEDLSLTIEQGTNVIRFLPPNLNELPEAITSLASVYRKFVHTGYVLEALNGNSSPES
jgi:hypothetical protein